LVGLDGIFTTSPGFASETNVWNLSVAKVSIATKSTALISVSEALRLLKSKGRLEDFGKVGDSKEPNLRSFLLVESGLVGKLVMMVSLDGVGVKALKIVS